MNICFFGLYNANYARTSTLREGLQRRGITVTEVHEEIPNERMELPEDFTLRKTVHRIGRKIACYWRLLKRYKEAVACDAIVVLHPGHLDLPLAWLLAKGWAKPLLFDSSISPYDTMFVGRSIADRSSAKAKAVKFIEKTLLVLPDIIFVDTEKMKQFLVHEVGVTGDKIIVVPLGANDTIYHPLKKEVKTVRPVHVFFFGLYNPMHGADVILKAAALLKNDKSIRFTLLGDGYLKPELVSLAKKNRLTNVTFSGFVPENELARHIREADIVLGVFSNSPVFQRVIPNKVFAAIASKKPLITAKLPALTDTFTHKESIMFCKPEDPKSLARIISELAKSKTLRAKVASGGYGIFQTQFTPQRVADALLTLFQEGR